MEPPPQFVPMTTLGKMGGRSGAPFFGSFRRSRIGYLSRDQNPPYLEKTGFFRNKVWHKQRVVLRKALSAILRQRCCRNRRKLLFLLVLLVLALAAAAASRRKRRKKKKTPKSRRKQQLAKRKLP